jgi:protein TonB
MAMSTGAEVPVEHEAAELAEASSPMMLVALIGPNEESRAIMARALAAPESRIVHEFSTYPEMKLEVLRMLSEHFDFLMIDLDSDEEFALHLVEMLTALSAPAVMVYSKREDRALMERATAAGAQDFFPLPANLPGAGGEGARPTGAGAQPAPAATIAPVSPVSAATPAAAVPERRLEAVRRYPESVSAQEIRRFNPLEPAGRGRIPRRIDSELTEVSSNGGLTPLLPSAYRPATLLASNLEGQREERHLPELSDAVKAAPETLRPAANPAPAPSKHETRIDYSIRAAAPADPSAVGLETDADVLHFARQIKAASTGSLPARAAGSRPALFTAALSTQDRVDENAEGPDWKRRGLIASGPLAMVLLIAFFFVHSPHRIAAVDGPVRSVPRQSQPQMPAPVTPAVADAANPVLTKPQAGTPLSADKKLEVPAKTAQLPSEAMTAQFTAPTRIAGGQKSSAVAESAPNALALGALYGGQVSGAALGESRKVDVRPEIVNVSAGVAVGMLIHKTAPIYPEAARQGHRAGTVVLKANITKEGKIAGLHVVSGPPVFAGPAVDAVKTWRYKPYMLDNKPVEVETTISVVFSAEAH